MSDFQTLFLVRSEVGREREEEEGGGRELKEDVSTRSHQINK